MFLNLPLDRRCRITVAGAALLFAASTATAQAQVSAKQLVQDVGIDQRLGEQIPLDLRFRDEQGRDVRLGDYFHDGKPVILNLVYYRCPMLCNQVMGGLLKSSQAVKLRLDDDYHIVTVSIDARETPALAAAKKESYVASYRRPGAAAGWHFLTGDQAAIDALATAVGYRYHYDPTSDQFAHASGIAIATPDGRLARYLYGIDYHPNDLRLGLVESSSGRIGTPVDQILLMCFHYDPATGKYGFVIHNVIRLAGTVTMLLLGGYLWKMFRQERIRSAEAVKQLEKRVTADESR